MLNFENNSTWAWWGDNLGAAAADELATQLVQTGKPRTTLERLNRYFPVPMDELEREFAGGLAAEEIAARSIRAALDAGAAGVYLSNLGLRSAGRRLRRILRHLDELPG